MLGPIRLSTWLLHKFHRNGLTKNVKRMLTA